MPQRPEEALKYLYRDPFPNASLISAPGGTTHAGSLSGVSCVDDKIADYLATGTLPKRPPGNHSDVQCSPVPPPVPDGAAAQKSDSSAKAAQEKQSTLAQLLHF